MVIEKGVVLGVEAGGGAFAGEGEADGVADALTEGAGGRFHAGGFEGLRVAGGFGMELAEIFQLIEREIVAGKVEPRVEEHRAVTGGEDEAVAIEPLGSFWIKPQAACTVEDGSDFGAAEWQAEVAGRAGVDGIHGEATCLVGGLGEDFGVHGI